MGHRAPRKLLGRERFGDDLLVLAVGGIGVFEGLVVFGKLGELLLIIIGADDAQLIGDKGILAAIGIAVGVKRPSQARDLDLGDLAVRVTISGKDRRFFVEFADETAGRVILCRLFLQVFDDHML